MLAPKVLLAYDGSEESQRALNHAQHYIDGELTLVTVVKDKQKLHHVNMVMNSEINPVILNSGSYQYPIVRQDVVNLKEAELLKQGHEQEIQEEGEDILRSAKHILEQNYLTTKTKVLQGDPVKAICEYADVHDFNLIIVGSRDLPGVKKLVGGSVSQKIVREANCPVLVVK